MNAFIRLLYALLIAASVVTFVGVAIFSAYQPPKGPAFPTTYSSGVNDSQFKAYDKANQVYHPKEQAYQRKVATIALVASVVVLFVGLKVLKEGVVAEGIALGGVGTSLYAIITASVGDGRLVRFLAVTLFLVSAVLVAQRRFAAAESVKKK